MDGRRRFNKRERDALYDDVDGYCAECERPLAPGWHADHITPHSRGGMTDETNGQALCPDCNLRKGSVLTYQDTFKPRPAQDEVIQAVLENVQNEVKQTVALLAPGSGKELLGQAVACHLYRLGIVEYVVTLVPRLQLAQQCETNWRSARNGVKHPRRDMAADWTGNFELFDSSGRIEFIEHTQNRRPIISPAARAQGITTTYQSLVADRGQQAFSDFAESYRGRFLVIVDEAQFCGDDEGGGGTKAGEMVKMLHYHAAHTLIMTGTAERSDGAPLVCCTYGEPNEKGVRPLRYDVRATYQDGIKEGYLRKFVAVVADSRVTRRDVDTNVETTADLSRDGSNLKQVLRRPDVWQPIADETAALLRDKRRRHPAYQGLISCMEKRDAEQVYAYLKRANPDLRVVIAVSDQEGATQVLRDFKTGAADILVTVRMAFIGYDCKTITTVGVLTNYRDKGHLMQLIGRGLRVSDHESFDAQSCCVVAPDDPEMRELIDELKHASEQGIRDRQARDPGSDGPPPPSASTIVVEAASPIGMRAEAADGQVHHDDYRVVMDLARQFGLSGDPQDVAAFVARLRQSSDDEQPTLFTPDDQGALDETPKTGRERIDDLCRDTSSIIKSAIVRDYGVSPSEPGFEDLVSKLTANVNKKAGGNSGKAKTLQDGTLAYRRYKLASSLYGADSVAP